MLIQLKNDYQIHGHFGFNFKNVTQLQFLRKKGGRLRPVINELAIVDDDLAGRRKSLRCGETIRG